MTPDGPACLAQDLGCYNSPSSCGKRGTVADVGALDEWTARCPTLGRLCNDRLAAGRFRASRRQPRQIPAIAAVALEMLQS
jgi:hypothetical protein